MKIAIIGSGYVGLTTGVCFAELGNDVICVDIDEKKVQTLSKGIPTIYETGLKDLLERNLKEKRISFTTDIKKAITQSYIIFIAVGTPQGEDHRADLRFVKEAAESIGKYMNSYKVVVTKSTVPVGTGDMIKSIIKKSQKKHIDFDVVSNPEFLREGQAIKDFMVPDRIVVGCETEKARKIMEELYKGIIRPNSPILFTNIKTAELIKYASNSMLATRISFMNMLSHYCEKVGADIKMVAKGMGLDSRIGPRFLQAGVGYGGSCFPKDVNALIASLEDAGCSASILNAVVEINEYQKRSIIPKIQKLVPDLRGKEIAIWGLAFKPKTDDMRDAPSIVIINELQRLGAKIKAFDPEAEKNAKKILKNVTYCETPYETIKWCDALVIVTEWDEFRNLDKEKIKKLMKKPNIIDGRNIYEPDEMKKLGFNYIGVGR